MDLLPEYLRDTVYWFLGKQRRKEDDSITENCLETMPGNGNSEGKEKLYLQPDFIQSHISKANMKPLVEIPIGVDENEWIASQIIGLFDNVNLIYAAISELCTTSTCPDMSGPDMKIYVWYDEKGKKVKVAAPQYVDYVMTLIQNAIKDEKIFPTKPFNTFPSSFNEVAKKICGYLFHVIAHMYQVHFKDVVMLSLHQHLNCAFAHFMIFNEMFKLVDEKETEVLQDLFLAMDGTKGYSTVDNNAHVVEPTDDSETAMLIPPDNE